MSYIYIFFFASLFLLGISLGFNLNFKQFNNAIHTYKRKGSAINGSKVRRKMEIDKRVLICISVSRKFYGYHGNQWTCRYYSYNKIRYVEWSDYMTS